MFLFKNIRHLSNDITKISFKKCPAAPVTKSTCFAVGDLETIVVNNIHYPVLAGIYFEIDDKVYHKIFSITNTTNITNIAEASHKMMVQYIHFMAHISKLGISIMYFHNLNFDGMFLMNALVQMYGNSMNFNSSIINGQIYSIDLYLGDKSMFIKCSFKLLPLSLDKLAKCLLGKDSGKMKFNTADVNRNNFELIKSDFIQYLYNDLIITHGILKIPLLTFLKVFNVNIHKILSASGLALRVFRTNFYDIKCSPKKFFFTKKISYILHTRQN